MARDWADSMAPGLLPLVRFDPADWPHGRLGLFDAPKLVSYPHVLNDPPPSRWARARRRWVREGGDIEALYPPGLVAPPGHDLSVERSLILALTR